MHRDTRGYSSGEINLMYVITTPAQFQVSDEGSENYRDLDNCLAYIDAAVRREAGDSAGADADNLHKLVHFHSEYSDRTGHSNTNLVRAIDDFSESSLDMHDFVHRSIQKIYYLIALRVWVEKRIYEEFPDLQLKGMVEIGSLIQEVDGRWARGEGESGRRGPSRQYLNSIKVMLNQNAHGLAQSAPFDHAVNLSSGRLCRKIEEVKEHLRQSAWADAKWHRARLGTQFRCIPAAWRGLNSSIPQPQDENYGIVHSNGSALLCLL